MNSLAIAARLFWLDVRWRIWLGAFALIVISVVAVIWNGPLRDPFLLDLLLFCWLSMTWVIGAPRISVPYQLGLPISTQTLFQSTLLVVGWTFWIPALTVAAFLGVVEGPAHIAPPLAFGVLWTAACCVLWIGWPKRPIAPRGAIFVVYVVSVVVGFWWLRHPPSLAWIAAPFILCCAGCLVVPLRLPATFEDTWSVRSEAVSSRSFFNLADYPWLVVTRISASWFGLLLFLVLVFQWRNWIYGGLCGAVVYGTLQTKDALLLNLPLSQVRLAYIRLGCSFLSITAASSIDLSGRLLRQHSEPNVVSILLAFTVTLLLVVAGKLPMWHRLRRLPKRLIALIPLLFFLATIVFSVVAGPQTTAVVPGRIALWLIGVIAVLLWLVGVQTREADFYATPFPSRTPFGSVG